MRRSRRSHNGPDRLVHELTLPGRPWVVVKTISDLQVENGIAWQPIEAVAMAYVEILENLIRRAQPESVFCTG